MSIEGLELKRLQEENKYLEVLARKQANSIIELCCVMVDITNVIVDTDTDELTAMKAREAFVKIDNIIRLKATRATNYLYFPKGDDVV